MNGVAVLALLVLFACAAARDVLTRTIPDWLCLSIAVIGSLLRLRMGLAPAAESLGGAAVLFLLLFLVYTRRAIGGGDVKLASALALGQPPTVTLHFIVATVFLGGAIGLIYATFRFFAPRPAGRRKSLLVRLAAIECWRARRRNSVPYGLAIAAGATVVMVPTLAPYLKIIHA